MFIYSSYWLLLTAKSAELAEKIQILNAFKYCDLGVEWGGGSNDY
jgi:hypothetical protein